MDIEVRDADISEVSEESKQKWISVKDGIPNWSESKGDWGGNYLCIVERPSEPDTLFYVEGGVSRTVELCYFNNLAKQWQDKDREWVTVTHWTQIPILPFHDSILISRIDMLSRISSGELKMIYNMKETDENYQLHRNVELASVSYNEPLYYSSTRSQHIEDYMYAVLNKKNI